MRKRSLSLSRIEMRLFFQYEGGIIDCLILAILSITSYYDNLNELLHHGCALISSKVNLSDGLYASNPFIKFINSMEYYL